MKKRFLKPSNNSTKQENSTTKLKTHSLPYNKTAKIKIISFGSDCVYLVKQTLKKLCLDKMEVIYLYLNLAKPETALLTKEFEKLGFFFSGVHPSPLTGDKLVLQYMNNVIIAYDKMSFYSDFTEEIMVYIKERDPHQKL